MVSLKAPLVLGCVCTYGLTGAYCGAVAGPYVGTWRIGHCKHRGTYRWAARKWVGPTLPFVWVLTVIGAGVVMMLRGGVRAELFNMVTVTLSVYWKDLVVAYVVEWFATPKGHTYARNRTNCHIECSAAYYPARE